MVGKETLTHGIFSVHCIIYSMMQEVCKHISDSWIKKNKMKTKLDEKTFPWQIMIMRWKVETMELKSHNYEITKIEFS